MRVRLSILFLGVFALSVSAVSANELEIIQVFTSGTEGYHTFRIPAMIVAADGTILAFAEGRASPNDQSRNDIVLKRSRDNGTTWEPLEVVAESGDDSLNNPCAVVVRETGRILLMHQLYPKGVPERKVVSGFKGDKICRNFLQYSDDHGKTWSVPKEITRQTKRKKVVTSIASGPGNAIQLARGEHAGRIIFPFNQGPWGQWGVYAVYSDNDGRTWKYGDVAPFGSKGISNEVQMVELTDGRIRINARSHEGSKLRKTALSEDGGVTWSPLKDVADLPEPQCNASIVRVSDEIADDKNRLMYTGPVSQTSRTHGTVFLSYDEGDSWPVKKQITESHFAYSSSARLNENKLGCLYEGGEKDYIEGIRLARYSLGWVTDNGDQFK
jgi:sialidase-1